MTLVRTPSTWQSWSWHLRMKRIFLNFYNIFTTLQLFKWIDNLIQILENTTFSDSKGANFAIGYNILLFTKYYTTLQLFNDLIVPDTQN